MYQVVQKNFQNQYIDFHTILFNSLFFDRRISNSVTNIRWYTMVSCYILMLGIIYLVLFDRTISERLGIFVFFFI